VRIADGDQRIVEFERTGESPAPEA